ncbi:glycosyltransferase [Collinsella sp. HCP28S3_E12]|uniref:glycosyltransferase n=1 Tax=Collinsella sp. HCP28S3_E12 TaxID=3438921 RepID=UPI003F8C1788
MVNLLILNYNDSDTTLKCVENALLIPDISKILVVDNHSTDDSYERLTKVESERVFVIAADENRGYGAGNNLGIKWLAKQAPQDLILLANPDTRIDAVTVKALECFLQSHLDYAIASPFMVNPQGEKQINTAFKIPSKKDYICSIGLIYQKYSGKMFYERLDKCTRDYVQVDGVSGSLFMMRPELVLDAGLFDEKLFLYCEEIVLAIRLNEKGYKCALLPNEVFVHDHSISISKAIKTATGRHRLLLKSKWYVLNQYYSLTAVEKNITGLLMCISMIEITLWAFLGTLKSMLSVSSSRGKE